MIRPALLMPSFAAMVAARLAQPQPAASASRPRPRGSVTARRQRRSGPWPRSAGGRGARPVGRTAHLRAVHRGSVLRPGLRDGAGPPVADGDVAPRRRGPARRGARRRRRCRAIDRHACSSTADRWTTRSLPDLPSGRALIMTAYVAGVNAFIEEATAGEAAAGRVRADRHPARAVDDRDAAAAPELLRRRDRRAAARAQRRTARRRGSQSPAQPGPLRGARRCRTDWTSAIIGDEVLAATRAGGAAPRPTVLPEFASIAGASPGINRIRAWPEPGSNNWVVSGAMSATGKPIVANDPHREVALPSLRYIVHLNAPGWNVTGSQRTAVPRRGDRS